MDESMDSRLLRRGRAAARAAAPALLPHARAPRTTATTWCRRRCCGRGARATRSTIPARLKPWLYRIATNACLDELARRPRRVLASDLGPAEVAVGVAAGRFDRRGPSGSSRCRTPGWAPGTTIRRRATRCARASRSRSSPRCRCCRRRSARPCSCATWSGCRPTRRPVALDQSVSATNSALHRARVAIEERVRAAIPASFAPTPTDEAALARYVRALADADVEAMIAIMHDDIQTTMPPSPTWLAGRAENESFYRRMFAAWTPGQVRAQPLGANGQPGFAFYRGDVAARDRGGRAARRPDRRHASFHAAGDLRPVHAGGSKGLHIRLAVGGEGGPSGRSRAPATASC